MNKTLATTLAICLYAFVANAQQKLSLDNIRSVSLRNSGAIMESEELKGYFFYYVSDKIDKNTNEYTIQILDEDVKPIKTIVFEGSKEEQLWETSYNSNTLLFMFFNKKEKTMTYKIYSLEGKLKYTYDKVLDKRSVAYLQSSMSKGMDDDDEGQNSYIYDIENRGYVSILPLRDGKDYSYEINLYLSDVKKQFSYTPNDEYKYSVASYLGTADNLAVFEVLKKERMMSNKMLSSLLAIDLVTGKKVFEIASDVTKYNFLPMNISSLRGKDEFLVLGTYYDKDDKVVKDKTLGIAAVTITKDGKISSEKYNGWANAFGKFLNISSKGTVEDIGYLYFHKILQAEDGNIFAIAEGYKRVANAGGIAITALAAASGGYSNYSVTRLNITDMVLIKFNEKFDVTDAKIYEKNKNKFSLPGGDYQSPHIMAAVAKNLGAYDYEFTRTDKFHTNFFIGYNDYERTKDYKGLTFHSISYANGTLSTDKINLTSKASSMRVLPSRAGFILISEYFKKEKRINLRVEKLN